MNIPSLKNKVPVRWEEFLKTFTDRISIPNEKLPTVRCITENTLSRLFEEIRADMKLPSSYPSGVKILQDLVSMGFAKQIELDSDKDPVPSKNFYSLGLQKPNDSEIDSLEILQAYHPSGVICFLSALVELNLTTQLPTHHNIAILIKRRSKPNSDKNDRILENDKKKKKRNKIKLGTELFIYNGRTFYSTKRIISSIPGNKMRSLNPWTNIRMTTIEQTLLDTLQYPIQCGGPETIFEAWENQIKNIKDERYLEYLRIIRIPPLTRRIGAIFDLFGYRPSDELNKFLKKSRNQFISDNEFHQISLLRGIGYSQLNPEWNVLIP